MRRRLVLVAALTAITSVGLWLGPRGHVAAQSLPASVSDKDFWSLIVGFSEPGGFFRSDNLISNELAYQHVIPELQKTPQPTDAQIRVAMQPNLCRCGTHMRILRAVKRASQS